MVKVLSAGGTALHIISEAPPVSNEFSLSRLNMNIGGPAGSVARVLARLGHTPSLLTAFADDVAGAALQFLFARDGINVARVATTSSTDIVFGYTVSDELTVLAHADARSSLAASSFVSAPVGYLSGFPGWREYHSMIDVDYLVADLGFKPYLEDPRSLHSELLQLGKVADAIFIGGASLAPSRIHDLIGVGAEARVPFLCISRGRRSALVLSRGRVVKVPVKGTGEPVDVMSAGDALVGGFIDGVLSGQRELEAIEHGLAIASASAMTLGDGE